MDNFNFDDLMMNSGTNPPETVEINKAPQQTIRLEIEPDPGVEVNLPVLNFDQLYDKFEGVDKKLDDFLQAINTKIEDCVKFEFKKTAAMLEGVVKQYGNRSSPLLQAIVPTSTATSGTESDACSEIERDLLNALNTKITSVEDIEKLEAALQKPEVVGQYVI